MDYSQARKYIESLQARGWRLGLDRMEQFLDRLGNPHDGLKAFHVAGTNGKGTVTATIAAILRRGGHRVGSYFSPYVYDFRERIQIDGEMISKGDVARLTEVMRPVADEMAYEEVGGPTEFEFKTAMAFLYWKERGVDLAAVEVGLGGRLDATNVIEAPLCSVITEIGMDHQAHLGDTVEKIAREKAGIIKDGRPTVTGVTDESAFGVIRDVAREYGSHLLRVSGEDFQVRNRAVAALAVKVGAPNGEAILKNGLPEVRLPGRMEIVSERPRIIFDGGHNEQAISAVLESLEGQVVCVYSAATGHAPLTELLAARCRKVLVAPMAHPRALPSAELRPTHPTVKDALMEALADLGEGETLLVTGSFYLLAEAKAALDDLTSSPE